MIKEIETHTTEKLDVININDYIENFVKESKINEGTCLVYVPHATAAIIINENDDPEILNDFLDALNKIVPMHNDYKHDRIDGNAAAHIKAAIIGPSETIPIKNGKLMLGRWQSIMLAEFDGPKTRKVIMQIMKEDN
jgi:secondary thiamine-phosphate synthase enzyme